MKVVLDTNVWISGLLLPQSKAGKLIAQWRSFKIDIVTCEPILDEIKKVLLYPKIRKRIQWDEAKIDQYILLLKFFTHLVSITDLENPVVFERDPNDSIILNTFISSQSDYLVTGDEDLLALKNQYAIITLAELYELIL